MPRPKSPREMTKEELEERKAKIEADKKARAESRARWIQENPQAHAAEQRALAENRQRMRQKRVERAQEALEKKKEEKPERRERPGDKAPGSKPDTP